MRRLVGAVLVLGTILAAVVVAGGASRGTADAAQRLKLTPIQQRLVSGFASRALEQASSAAPSTRARSRAAAAATPTNATGCPANRGANVRVNQNCLNLTDPDLQGRGQAENETAIAQDPNNPSHIVASANDYRRGDGNCFSSFSSDGGSSWTDSTPPMSFTRGTAFGDFPR